MKKIIVIAHDIRSTHNIGSLLRTCEGLGVEKIFMTGYTPYPKSKNDVRLPHIAEKMTKQITKTALGAENLVSWEHHESITVLLSDLKSKHYQICALEQASNSTLLPDFNSDNPIAIVLGREVEGIEKSILLICDAVIEIPMFGHKESFNVVQAAAIAISHIVFMK